MLIRPAIYLHFKQAVLCAAALLALLSNARAQSVPIPFAGTLAGGGTVCATSLPVFAVNGAGAKYGDGCPATQATLNVPVAAATDSLGNVFIADQTNQLVRVVYNGGTALAAAIVASNVQNTGLVPVKGNIYTIAGGILAASTQTPKYCNQAGNGPIGTNAALDGCPASESEQGPRGLALDADGNLFISSVSPFSQIRVFYVGGTAAARLITLENPTITAPLPGYVYNVAGGNASSYTLDGSLATKATMNTPRGLLIDLNENIYFADQANNVIRRVDGTTGILTTVAGHCVVSGSACTATATSGDGSAATSAAVNIYAPYGVAFDQYGNLFIAEAGSATLPGRIRVVYAAGTLPGIIAPNAGSIYTYAGGLTGTTQAQLTVFQEVFGVTIDSAGYVYVTDYRTGTTGSNHLWKIDPTNGNITSIAGTGGAALTTGKFCNGGTTGPVTTNTRGDGCPATQAYLANPQEQLAFDARGNFYIADRVNNVVRSFTYNNLFPATPTQTSVTQSLAFALSPGSTPTAETFTLQGSATAEYADAGGATCPLNTPVATATTCVINVKFTPAQAGLRLGSIAVSGATGTLATQSLSGSGLGPVLTISSPASVSLGANLQPLGISTDGTGKVYVSDGTGKQVIKTSIAGGATTVALTGLGSPRQTTTDSSGNVFVADAATNRVVELTAAGTTVNLGTGLSAPQGVVADLLGNLYIADTGNNQLVYLSPATGNQRVLPVSGFTLSAPTSLALDAAGDLFVIDTKNTRLLEIPLGVTPLQLALPSGATPAALALDPGSNLYLADTASQSILFVAAGTTTATTFATGVTTPTGIAVGNNGNIFIADSTATTATGYNVVRNNTVFSTTNIGLTSLPATLTLSNAGNASATLQAPPYTETGTAAAFPANGQPTCTAGATLAPDATCTQAFVFMPATPGPQSAQVVFTPVTGQAVTSNLSATATNLILTSLTISPVSSSTTYGQAVTYTATFTKNSTGANAPTGTISFIVDGKTVATQNVASPPFTYTLNAPAAMHTVAALYSGDALYAGSNVTTFLTVARSTTATTVSAAQSASGTVLTAVVSAMTVGPLAPTGYVTFTVDGVGSAQIPVGNGTVSSTYLLSDGPHTYSAGYTGDSNYTNSNSPTQTLTVARNTTSLALTITPASINGVGVFQLKATLTATGNPTGTITFSNGGTNLGTVNLSTVVAGSVTFTTTSTTFTSYTFTAIYSGDGLFSSSTATATEGPDFIAIVPATGISVPQGAQAILAVPIQPINGYTGTLTASCSALPANTICRFLPIPLVVTGVAANLTVEVFAGVNPNVASVPVPPLQNAQRVWLAILCMMPLTFTFGRAKTSLPRLAACLLAGVIASALVGCGNKTPASVPGSFTAPVGTSTFTLTLTDTNNVSRSSPVTLTITQ